MKRWNGQRLRVGLAALAGLFLMSPLVKRLSDDSGTLTRPMAKLVVGTSVLRPESQVHTSRSATCHSHHQPVAGRAGRDAEPALARDTDRMAGPRQWLRFLPWEHGQHSSVLPVQMVYVGGQSVGVRLYCNGVLVVGFQRIGPHGESPAALANIQLGDVIERVGQYPVSNADQLRRYVNRAPEDVMITVRHGTQRKTVRVHAITDLEGFRHLGVYVRDKTSGIGTLTFYDPSHHCFGALGHVITDADTGQPIIGTGSLYQAEVTGVSRGVPGRPGEKKGHFLLPQFAIGHIEENNEFGVFGRMDHVPGHLFDEREFPVASPGQAHHGPATLLTVLHGQKVEAYRVEIENLARQEAPGTRSMVIHVTDPRLLAETGGIVQGMSGSPIIQDGRLIGAVTHVFLSDVTRGYGVYAAWMVQEAQKCSGVREPEVSQAAFQGEDGQSPYRSRSSGMKMAI